MVADIKQAERIKKLISILEKKETILANEAKPINTQDYKY